MRFTKKLCKKVTTNIRQSYDNKYGGSLAVVRQHQARMQ